MKIIAIFIILCMCACSDIDSKMVLEKSPPVVVRGALSENIGIEVMGGVFVPIVTTANAVPSVVPKIFSAAEDNQDQMTIAVYRGNSRLAKENTFLGKFKITGFSPVQRGTSAVQISFGVSSKEIWIEAEDLKEHKRIKIERL